MRLMLATLPESLMRKMSSASRSWILAVTTSGPSTNLFPSTARPPDDRIPDWLGVADRRQIRAEIPVPGRWKARLDADSPYAYLDLVELEILPSLVLMVFSLSSVIPFE
jgi:hypothetical protein